jgi:hypothetical protein
MPSRQFRHSMCQATPACFRTADAEILDLELSAVGAHTLT